MSRKDTVNSLFMTKLGAPNPPPAQDKERVRSGAISAMGSSLQQLADDAKAASRLQEQLAAGQVVIELDPALIDGSMVRDRLTLEVDPSFDALVESIDVSGQQVPILVRPHPKEMGRYQVAYGHRRLRAVARLGRSVRAVVQKMTDDELVVAQGKENLERKDLSFIEKALFARRLEDMGFERAVIVAALSTDKGDLSRYISVARMIPEDLLIDIGPAGKAGRARWLTVAERLELAGVAERLVELRSSEQFRASDSDGRFALVFGCLTSNTPRSERAVTEWSTSGGLKAARVEYGRGKTTLTIDERLAPKFGAFVASRLDELHRRFLEEGGQTQGEG